MKQIDHKIIAVRGGLIIIKGYGSRVILKLMIIHNCREANYQTPSKRIHVRPYPEYKFSFYLLFSFQSLDEVENLSDLVQCNREWQIKTYFIHA